MRALGELTRLFGKPKPLEPSARPEPELINGKPREMTGFFAQLTPEQKAEALSYRGPEAVGDRAFLQKRWL